MSVLNSGTLGAFKCNVLTQTQTIAGQLAAGARYFDIRPVIRGGQFYTGHYSRASYVWQGANGQSIQEVIDSVNAYTATHPELVILNVSHDLNTDLGHGYYAPFLQAEWEGLLQQLMGLDHRFVAQDPASVDLTTLPLSHFIGQGRAAVVIIVQARDPSITLGPYANQGFYRYAQMNAYNSHSSTDDVEVMASDQLQKLVEQRPDPNAGYFLLSWTLTQEDRQAATCWAVRAAPSRLELSRTANAQLLRRLPQACTPRVFPNIISVDDVSGLDVVGLSMHINARVGPGGLSERASLS